MTEISISALVLLLGTTTWYYYLVLLLGAASQYLDGFLECNSQNCDITLAVIVTASDALPLCYVTLDNRRKDA